MSEKAGKGKVIGFFNTNKKNPKEPDIRIYVLDEKNNIGKEVASLWDSLSKQNVRYLTGITDEKEKLVGFYGNEHEEKRPFIRVYFEEE